MNSKDESNIKYLILYCSKFRNHIDEITIYSSDPYNSGSPSLNFSVMIGSLHLLEMRDWACTPIGKTYEKTPIDRRISKLAHSYSKFLLELRDEIEIACADFSEFHCMANYIKVRIEYFFSFYLKKTINVKIESEISKNEAYKEYNELIINDILTFLCDSNTIKRPGRLDVNSFVKWIKNDLIINFDKEKYYQHLIKSKLDIIESSLKRFYDLCNYAHERTIIGKIKYGTSLTTDEVNKNRELIYAYRELEKVTRHLKTDTQYITTNKEWEKEKKKVVNCL